MKKYVLIFIISVSSLLWATCPDIIGHYQCDAYSSEEEYNSRTHTEISYELKNYIKEEYNSSHHVIRHIDSDEVDNYTELEFMLGSTIKNDTLSVKASCDSNILSLHITGSVSNEKVSQKWEITSTKSTLKIKQFIPSTSTEAFGIVYCTKKI